MSPNFILKCCHLAAKLWIQIKNVMIGQERNKAFAADTNLSLEISEDL